MLFTILSLCCPTLLRISCAKALTSSFYFNPYGLMYKIPISLQPWDPETSTDQTWTQQEAPSCCFDFPSDAGCLTAIPLHGFPRDLHWVGAWTGWQRRSIPGQATCRSGCWCSADVQLQCHWLFSSVFTAFPEFMLQYLSSTTLPRPVKFNFQPSMQGWFLRDRLVCNDIKLPWCYKPDLCVFMYPATMYRIKFCICFFFYFFITI